MSAKNWRTCPACEKERSSTVADAQRKLSQLYGAVIEAEYLAEKAKVEEIASQELEATMREDYEIYMRHDRFHVRYSANCTSCGASFDFMQNFPCEVK